MPDSVNVTQLLRAVATGDKAAEDQLFQLLYAELHKSAVRRMSRERQDHTLQPTALVHEVFLRLMGSDEKHWNDRQHFLATASLVMRRILVDYARKKNSNRTPKLELKDNMAVTEDRPEEILAVHTALDRLAQVDPAQAKIVELRYFGGLTEEETALVVGLSERQVRREWSMARGWLKGQLEA